MDSKAVAALLALGLVLCPSRARAEGPEPEEERHFVLGLGGALALDPRAREINGGGTAFLEIEVIERWLEIELGVSVVTARPGVEMSSDILLKKPFQLRKGIELMVGVGPEIVQTFASGPRRTYFGVAGALDFMFWPTKHVGFWVQPGYDLVFRDRASLGFGTTGGPIVGW